MYNSVPFQYTTGASTNLTQLGAASGSTKLCGYVMNDTAAYDIFVKLWWGPQGTTPTVGTTVPTITIGVPAPSTTVTPGQVAQNFSNPIVGNGVLWMWITKLPAASDATATAAGDGIITLLLQ